MSQPTLTSVATVALIAVLTPGARAQSCGSWQITDNPVFQGQETIPIHIVAFTPASAVGLRNVNDNGQLAVAHMRWDGVAWTVLSADPIPDLEGGTGWELRAAVGSAPDDLWGAGLAGVDNFHGVPFLARFDGQEWTAEMGTLFDDPNPEAGDPVRSAEGADLVVIAPDDIWVVGTGDDLEKTVSSPVASHWDGSNLDEVGPVVPVYNRINQCEAGAGIATDDVWLVGYGRNTGETFHLFTHHWDGSTWSAVTEWIPLGGPQAFSDYLYDIVAPDADNVWAVGKKLVTIDGTTHSVSLYLRWDGAAWAEVPGPDIGPLTSATAAAPDDIWASNAFGEYGGRVAHWDGSSWSEIFTASIPDATHVGLARVAASPAGDVWAIGYWAIYDGAGGWDVFQDHIQHMVLDCSGDTNGDGVVDVSDFLALLGAWGSCPSCPEDLDGNSMVDTVDLLMLLANWS